MQHYEQMFYIDFVIQNSSEVQIDMRQRQTLNLVQAAAPTGESQHAINRPRENRQ